MAFKYKTAKECSNTMHKKGNNLYHFINFSCCHSASTCLSIVNCNSVFHGTLSLVPFSTNMLQVGLQNQVPEWNMWLKALSIITVLERNLMIGIKYSKIFLGFNPIIHLQKFTHRKYLWVYERIYLQYCFYLMYPLPQTLKLQW